MRTANPALQKNTFEIPQVVPAEAMTIQGTVHKTAVLLGLLVLSASWVWGRATAGMGVPQAVWWGAVLAFIVAIVTCFKKDWAPVTGPIYAILEGLFLGGVSALMEAAFPGIVIQAVSLTFGTLACLLLAYRSGLVKPSENFKLGIVAATGGICVLYLIDLVINFFGARIPFIHESGVIGIAFSLFVVVLAALNLVLDFDFIEHGAERGAPKYMEWYAAFGLMITLVWLYLEILRLLAKLRSRR
jgi:uncharacterized YccA/Bax inhibitor family protein